MDFEENAAFRKYDDGSTEVSIILCYHQIQIMESIHKIS